MLCFVIELFYSEACCRTARGKVASEQRAMHSGHGGMWGGEGGMRGGHYILALRRDVAIFVLCARRILGRRIRRFDSISQG